MDRELDDLLRDVRDDADWTALARALRRRGFPALPASFEAARRRVARLEAAAREQMPRVFEAAMTRLFERHAELEEVAWPQYVPFYMDEPYQPTECVANLTLLELNGRTDDPALDDLREAVLDVLAPWSEQGLLAELFGSDAWVRVTRQGAFVEHHEAEPH